MSQRMHWVLGAGWVGGTTNPAYFQKYFQQQKQFLTQRPLEICVLLPFFKISPPRYIFFVCLWRCGERRRQKRLGTPVTGWWAPGVEGGHLRHINCPQQAIKPPPPSPYGPKLSTINGWCYLPPSQWLPKLFHYICRNHSWAKHRLQRHTMQSNARPIGMGVTVKTIVLKIYNL